MSKIIINKENEESFAIDSNSDQYVMRIGVMIGAEYMDKDMNYNLTIAETMFDSLDLQFDFSYSNPCNDLIMVDSHSFENVMLPTTKKEFTNFLINYKELYYATQNIIYNKPIVVIILLDLTDGGITFLYDNEVEYID